MEGVALEDFNKLKPSTISMAQFHSHLSDGSYQDTNTTATYLHIILHLLLSKWFIASFLTTIWDNTDGCTKQYCCASAIGPCPDVDFLLLLKNRLVYLYTKNTLLLIL